MTRTVNIAEFKDNLSKYLEAAERGEEVVICRRNVPVVRLAPQPVRKRNLSQPGWGVGTVQILGDVEGPAIPEEDWNMFRDDHDTLA